MKERPILMTPENAQKCFDWIKTQTRRLVKGEVYDDWTLGFYHPLRVNHRGEDYPADRTFGLWGDGWDIPCPYGQVGDRFWIREAWAAYSGGVTIECEEYDLIEGPIDINEISPPLVVYKGQGDSHPERWRPGIHMYRWACRTVVEITEIRVQRVQEISYDDEGAEGIVLGPDCNDRHSGFIALWESINGAGSWAENRLVWALTFKKV